MCYVPSCCWYLRQCLHMSLRRLGLESMELYQLHRVDQQRHRALRAFAQRDLDHAHAGVGLLGEVAGAVVAGDPADRTRADDGVKRVVR